MMALGSGLRRFLAAGSIVLLAGAGPLQAAQANEAPPAGPETSGKMAAPDKAAEIGAKPAETAGGSQGSLAPYQAIRSLQQLQDRVAHGSLAAQAAEPKLLVRIGEVFGTADPTAWADSRNAGAAVLYLFSAGRPSVVRAAVRQAALSPANDRLIKGALAYAEGQDDVARALLGTFDPRALPALIGGHLALVLATLYADTDPLKAGQMLDAARLLVPGTLVEEAALRRQIFLSARPAMLDKFSALSRQYLRRFHGSVFAGNFKARLVSFAERIALSGEVAQMAKLDAVLAELPAAEARGIYLTMARDALVAGRSEGARYAAARATASATGAAADAARAKLYAAAAIVSSDDVAAGRAALRSIDAGRLSPRDADLRDAALTMAASVEADPVDRDPGAALPDGAAAALMARAQAALSAGDKLLGRTP
jgi:chemotaxis protein MotC